jgi:nucleotide-binding universal stress UspA family protein
MALKDILVHLDQETRSGSRLTVAAELAQRHRAYLSGLCIVDVPTSDYLYGAGLVMPGSGPDKLVEDMTAEARRAAQPIQAAFRETLRSYDLQGECRIVEGHTTAVIGAEARHADMVVVGQPNDPKRHDNRGRMIVETVLMTSGRPVLVVPFAGDFKVLTNHVLVAWNGSREATRAVHDALPLLQEARHVTVLAINAPASPGRAPSDEPRGDIVTHLLRHGVRVEMVRTTADDIPEGDALLSYAADISANLIVAGGYGHSRAHEMIFGGVTRTLLTEMTVPVFFSH